MKSRATIYRHFKKAQKKAQIPPGRPRPIELIVQKTIRDTLAWVLQKKAPEPSTLIIDAQLSDLYTGELLNALYDDNFTEDFDKNQNIQP